MLDTSLVMISLDGRTFYYDDPLKKTGSTTYFPHLLCGIQFDYDDEGQWKAYYDLYSFNANGKYFTSVDSPDDVRTLGR